MISFTELRDADKDTKPNGADEAWIRLGLVYEDQARTETIKDLHILGVGLSGNTHPIEIQMLRRIVDRLAAVYSKAPTRWLRKGAKRIAESNASHRAMIEAFSRAQYDLAWKRIDQLRTLFRQVVVRLYPDDTKGSVVVRCFEPHNVLRAPSSGLGDTLDGDEAFALCTRYGADEAKQRWELWGREGAGWTMTEVDGRGTVTARPFALSEDVSTYERLPVFVVYDELAMGRPWLPPRSSRIANQRAVNAIINDLWSLIVHQAHGRNVINTDDQDLVPDVHGHGGTMRIGRDDKFSIVQPDPRIAEAQNALDYFAMLWLLGEDMPINEFRSQTQILTGAALLVAERAMNARREAQVPLAIEDERTAYPRFAAVHNLHTRASASTGGAWDQAELDASLRLVVEIAEVTAPQDPKTLQDVALRDIVAGAASVIDYIAARDACSRDEAIATYERVAQDNESYPAGRIADAPGPHAPDVADPADPQDGADPDLATTVGEPSIVDAL